MINVSLYGNSLYQWVGLILILGLSVVVSRVTIWRLSRTVRKLFKEENTELDDLLGNAFERPLFFMLILCGVWLGFKIMTVSPALTNFFDRIWQFLFTLTATWMVACTMFFTLLTWWNISTSAKPISMCNCSTR